jgi:hypothetical protein
MIPDTLIENLLKRPESPTLDFKSEWYKIDSDNSKAVETQKGELIKDILSLANGNANVAGETAYLIIGVSDEVNEQGEREIFDVPETDRISSDRILKIVNTVCRPPLENLICDVVVVREKRIIVITIPPSPYLYEIQSKIQTPKRSFDEYTVFVRQGEKISTASTKERISIEQLKMLRYQEVQNVPPVQFGVGIGATIGGLLLPGLAEKALKTKESRTAGFIVGIFTGGFLGGMFGSIFRDIRDIQRNWKYTPLKAKILGISAGALISSVFFIITGLLKKPKSG